MNLIHWPQYKKIKWAVSIALVFHLVGFAGILWIDQPGFVEMTPMNLMLSVLLLVWTQHEINFNFFLFATIAFITGIVTEYLGVNYQLLFGHYRYEHALGLKIGGVPLMIGMNWFMVIYCCGMTTEILLNVISNRFTNLSLPSNKPLLFFSVIIDGAFLAMFFDWLMEPVAIKLGYWTWLADGGIPTKNYWDWFFVSAFLMIFFRLLNFPKKNQFALHLLLIQTLFFLSLRILLS
jgi:putative membrane protein